MKIKFKTIVTMSMFVIGILCVGSCSNGDIDELRDEMHRSDKELGDRITLLEQWQKSANEEIQSLGSILRALESKDYVTGVKPLGDGSGYVITFDKSGDVTIRNGEDGAKGDTPVISVKQGNDGLYYWTVDGKFLKDVNGNNIPATGSQGEPGDTPYIGDNGNWWIGTKDTGVHVQGKPGDTPYVGDNGNWWIGTEDSGVHAQGEPGITPLLQINSETNEWEISVDNGLTWKSTGVKATGAEGKQGDSWFKGIDTSNSEYVELTLVDGTVLRLPKYAEMFVKFSSYEPFLCSETLNELVLILPEGMKESDYTALMATITSADGSTDIVTRSVESSGWCVQVVKPSFDTDGTLVPGSSKVRITGMPEERGEHTAMLKVTIVDAEGHEYSSSRVVKCTSTGNLKLTVNGVMFEMTYVEGGTFLMGSQDDDSDKPNYCGKIWDDEEPVHPVTLSDYYMGKFEVTQGLWMAVMGSNPSYFTSANGYTDDLQRPVEGVSWNDICGTDGFLDKLNTMLEEQLDGKEFVLPTEAQWEFAAGGGIAGHNPDGSRKYTYSGSDNIDDFAWYWGNIPSRTSGEAGYGTQPAGTKQANELGIYDMSGNVWEWCHDWYDGKYYQSFDLNTAVENPEGPESGSGRVYRGGSWGRNAEYCRVTLRDGYGPDDRNGGSGFRLALLPR